MAKIISSCDRLVEDEYIDMDIRSTTLLCYGISSPPHSREFEFQMSFDPPERKAIASPAPPHSREFEFQMPFDPPERKAVTSPAPPHSRDFEFQRSFNPPEREATTSPADELFYKGKLLPLHLPPRLQMVQKLLQNSDSDREDANASEDNLATPTVITSTTTPPESCNTSSADSCQVSGELSPEDYSYQCSTELPQFQSKKDYSYQCSAELTQFQSKKSWSKKLKLITQSSLSLKLKASRAYLKSLLTKSKGSDGFNAAHKDNNCSNRHLKAEEKNKFVQSQKERWLRADTNVTTLMRSIEREKLLEEECMYRKSFSGAINCHLTPRSSPTISACSSSSSSFSSVNSNRFYGPQMLIRSSSVNSEMESSIQGAIAYCKKSQVSARKSVSDVEFCSISASSIVAARDNEERPGICRG